MTPSFMAKAGATLVERGYRIIPIAPGGKAPGIYTHGEWRLYHEWSRHCDRPTTANEVQIWSAWPDCGVGIACGNMVGIDIDVLDASVAHTLRQLAFDMLGETVAERIGMAPKRLLCYRADVAFRGRKRAPIEVLARGNQFVAYHIHPGTGQPYAWPETGLVDVDASTLPVVHEGQVLAFLDAAYAAVPPELRPSTVIGSTAHHAASDSEPRGTREAIADALRHIPNDDMDRESWVRIGMAMKGALGDDGRDMFVDWSRQSSKSGASGKNDTPERKWAGFKPGSIGAGTIYHLAMERGWTPDASLQLNGAEASEPPAVQQLIDMWTRDAAPAPAAQGDAPAGRASSAAPVGANGKPLPDLGGFVMSEFDGQPVPEREWLVPDWIPIGYVSLVYAAAGVGKSLLMQLLMTCCATGKPFLGMPVRRCRAIGFFAEDEVDELRRRQEAINAHLGVRTADLDDMKVISGVGRVSVLATMGKDGIIKTTPVFEALEHDALAFGAGFVGIDTAGTSFGANENDRSAVTQYVGGVLTGLAQRLHAACQLNCHPSKSGDAEGGSGDSGSTGWGASSRSRLYMEYGQDREGRPDRLKRVLTRMKANYAPSGVKLTLEWTSGVLALEGLGSMAADGIKRVTRDDETSQTFLNLLHQHLNRGLDVGGAVGGKTYAPLLFSRLDADESGGASRRDFERAMRNLLDSGHIAIEEIGRTGNTRKVLRMTEFCRTGAPTLH